MAYTVQFERKGKFLRTTVDSKRLAVKLACTTSKLLPGYHIAVLHKGIEVASCHRGKVKK